MIQGYKLQCNINSMDFNSPCTHFATGGKDCNPFPKQTSEYSVSARRTMRAGSKYKKHMENTEAPAKPKPTSANSPGTNQESTSWPSEPAPDTFLSTTPSLPTKTWCRPRATKVPSITISGDIKNVQWCPSSRERFVTSCFDNEIIEWDIRYFSWYSETRSQWLGTNSANPSKFATWNSTHFGPTN